jgi:tetratricopeptide (TPR) repeat protein
MRQFLRDCFLLGVLASVSVVIAQEAAPPKAADQKPAAQRPLGQPADLPPGKIRGASEGVTEIIVNGRLLRNDGKYDEALVQFGKALELARFTKDRPGEAWSLSNKATVHRYRAEKERNQGQRLELIKQSAELYEQSANIARESADKHNEAYATLYLGVLAAMRNEPAEALRRYAVALPLFEAEGDLYYVGRTYWFQARSVLAQRDFDKGMELYEKALPCLREARMFNEVAEILTEMQAVYKAVMQ